MDRLSISNVKENIDKIVVGIIETGNPICVTSKSGNVVILSEEEWSDIEETLYIMSNRSTYTAIKQGLNTPISGCTEEIDL